MNKSKYFEGPSGVYYDKGTDVLFILEKIREIMWVQDNTGEKSSVYRLESNVGNYDLVNIYNHENIEYIGKL